MNTVLIRTLSDTTGNSISPTLAWKLCFPHLTNQLLLFGGKMALKV